MKDKKKQLVKIFFDGSCWNGQRLGGRKYTEVDKSNSSMGIGVVVVANDLVLQNISYAAGIGSNNEAEYIGAITALHLAKEYYDKYHDVDVKIFSDSLLICNQFNGHWGCKAKELKPLLKRAKEVSDLLPWFHRITWIPREENALADVQSKNGNPYHRAKKKAADIGPRSEKEREALDEKLRIKFA